MGAGSKVCAANQPESPLTAQTTHALGRPPRFSSVRILLIARNVGSPVRITLQTPARRLRRPRPYFCRRKITMKPLGACKTLLARGLDIPLGFLLRGKCTDFLVRRTSRRCTSQRGFFSFSRDRNTLFPLPRSSRRRPLRADRVRRGSTTSSLIERPKEGAMTHNILHEHHADSRL
jgi:hypothetical protein